MKKFFSISGLLALFMLLLSPAVTSCDDGDKYSTEQYKGGVRKDSREEFECRIEPVRQTRRARLKL